MPAYFINIAIPIVAAFLGLSYPLILQAIIRLDDKYPGVNVTSHFKKNWAFVAFDRVGVTLFLFFIVFVALSVLKESIGYNSVLLNQTLDSFHILLTVFIFIEIALLFYTIRSILIYSDSKSFVEFLNKQNDKDPILFKGLVTNFIQSDNVELFLKIDDCFFKNAYLKNEKFEKELLNYHYALVYTLHNHDHHNFLWVKKRIYSFTPIFGDGTKNISDHEFALIWYALKLIVKKNDFATFQSYWSYIVQYIHHDLRYVHPSERGVLSRESIALEEWNDRKFGLVFFHFIFLSYLQHHDLNLWIDYTKKYKPSGYNFPEYGSFINSITLPEIVLLFNYFMNYDYKPNYNLTFDLAFPFGDQYDHVSADIGYRAVLAYFQEYISQKYNDLRKELNYHIPDDLYTYESLNDNSFRHLLLQKLDDINRTDFDNQITLWKRKYIEQIVKAPIAKKYITQIVENVKSEILKIKECFAVHFTTMQIEHGTNYQQISLEHNFDKVDLLDIGPSLLNLETILTSKFKNEFSGKIGKFLNQYKLPVYNFSWKDFIRVVDEKVSVFKDDYVIYVHGLSDDLNIHEQLSQKGYNVIVLNYFNLSFLDSGLIILNKNWLELAFNKPFVKLSVLGNHSTIDEEFDIDDKIWLVCRQFIKGGNVPSSVDHVMIWTSLIYRLEFKVNNFCNGFILQNFETLWQGKQKHTINDVIF